MRHHRSDLTSSPQERQAPARPGRAAGRRADAVVPGRAGPGHSPREVIALQRTVGNRAAAGMVEQDRHEHGADCGHPQTEQVQRSVASVLGSGGRPLDAATRGDMEARLGSDFSDVRIHDDSAARASAAGIGARAYTSGSHVVLGDGGTDRHTLAHELTHVIQQRLGPVAGTDNGAGLRISDPGDRFEREAEANAARVLATDPAPQTAQDTVELPPLTLPGAQTPVQRTPKADVDDTATSGSRREPYPGGGGRSTRSSTRKKDQPDLPEADLNSLRLSFRSEYEGPATQRLDEKQDIGFYQVATLHAPENLPRSVTAIYDFKQQVKDSFVYYERVEDDGDFEKKEQRPSAWAQDGPYQPEYDEAPEAIAVGSNSIEFNDHPGWSGRVAMTPGSWLARYSVSFRWKIKRRDARGGTWTSPAVTHNFTSPFAPNNPVESAPVTATPAGNTAWDVTLT
ncbi:DUF4157 domain-containing protein [Micromonospora sp. NPDC020750]|uniref:eCIS core domain-containing protein n=1 Tax=unclassified Micromonospora TaxID=2617518 RepID=UPI00378A5E1D